ncbi:MAG: hypothetical protein M1528_01650 [Candidatus Marsarchaeota archaeon]|nr:hypothetical protein [Candidatus Marsarchaeota archaeon]MCL5115218.1 hypothetical protein [Candidatus Marsarchaeota archaeon]
MRFSISNLFKKKRDASVVVTSINLRWKGQMHALGGMQINEKRFTIAIPFQNKTQQDALQQYAALKEKFKAQEVPPILISSIQLSDPFKFVSVEPALPITVKSGEKVEMKVTGEAPAYGYSGPITVTLSSSEARMVKIQINKVILTTERKSVEIENSGVILNMPPNGIFKNSIQMYKALSYGDVVTNVIASPPFEFEGAEPKLPFTISEPSSYIVTFFIKAPDVDYAGPMEIKVE